MLSSKLLRIRGFNLKLRLSLNRALPAVQRCLSSQELLNYRAVNEPMPDYAAGTREREEVQQVLKEYDGNVVDIPIVIGDEEIRTDNVRYQVSPFSHDTKIAKYYYADEALISRAISVALEARAEWETRPADERAEVFLRAADLFATKYRSHIVATTMLGQAKTVWQAEIDAGAELIDFLRFNVQNLGTLLQEQPASSEANENYTVYRGMEGFWAAVSPFNFTAIGGNLASAQSLLGNVTVWKPSDTAMLSSYVVMKAFREAGMPPGVINLVPADGPVFGKVVTSHPQLAGLNFTGSLRTFQTLWKSVGENIFNYTSFPRLIGECGGKNSHFVHSSADVSSVVNNTIRSAFEYGGQKCSACSRIFVPESLADRVKEGLVEEMKKIKMASPLEFDTFFSAVIDDKSFGRIKGYLDYARDSPDLTIVQGGTADDSVGYYVEPTLIMSTNPQDKLMTEEIFGPVLAMYVYPDNAWQEMLDVIDQATPYGLTGAIFAEDSTVISEASLKLRFSAGNFYINTKSTGSVVGQQPFGGARLSGTNDKAGGPHYLLRFTNPLSVSVARQPLKAWDYPSMR